jgi:hypothetical protein
MFTHTHEKYFEEKPHEDAAFKLSNIGGIVVTRKSDRLLGVKKSLETAASKTAVTDGDFSPDKRSDYRGSIIPQKARFLRAALTMYPHHLYTLLRPSADKPPLNIFKRGPMSSPTKE